MITAKQPLLEIDHAYIMVMPDAPEAAYLQSRGLFLLEDIRHHEGQGTVSFILLFKNMYLELAWVHDQEMMLQTCYHRHQRDGSRLGDRVSNYPWHATDQRGGNPTDGAYL